MKTIVGRYQFKCYINIFGVKRNVNPVYLMIAVMKDFAMWKYATQNQSRKNTGNDSNRQSSIFVF
jgi:hypothetical protein